MTDTQLQRLMDRYGFKDRDELRRVGSIDGDGCKWQVAALLDELYRTRDELNQYGDVIPAGDPQFCCGVPRDGRWAAVRQNYVKRHPTCAACGGRSEVEVHHVVPVSWPGGKELELEERNFVSLCRVHHLWVGHLGSWESRNPDVREDAATWLRKVTGRGYPPGARG